MLTTGQRKARQQPACFPLVVIDLYPQVFHRHDYPLVRSHRPLASLTFSCSNQ
jgi:hypothetical protein